MAPRWDERVARIVRLARAGVMVLVDHAWDARLPELLRALRRDAEPVVCLDPDALFDLPEGSTVVFVPLAEHASALNAGRPRVAQRALKVILWTERRVSVALAREAPDFFDWISHRIECPEGIPPHVLAGIDAAERAKVRGIVCSGLGALDDEECVEGMQETGWDFVDWSDSVLDLPLEALWSVGSARRVWVEDLQTGQDLNDLRVALATVGSRAQVVASTHAGGTPGWWHLDAKVLEIREAARNLTRLPTDVAAMFGGEEAAIELANQLLDAGEPPDTLTRMIRRATDSGAALARAALRRRLVSAEEVALGRVSAPLLRGLADHRAVVRATRRIERECRERLARGDLPRADEIGWCVARSSRAIPIHHIGVFPTEAAPFLLEAFERGTDLELPPPMLIDAASDAMGASLFLELIDVWGQRLGRDDPRRLLLAAKGREDSEELVTARVAYIALLNDAEKSVRAAAALGRARVCRLLGRYDEVIAEYKELEQDRGFSPEERVELLVEAARSFVLAERLEEARTLRKEIQLISLRLDKTARAVARRHARRLEARLAVVTGETRRALELLGTGPDFESDVDWFLLQAEVRLMTGAIERAADCCDSALSLTREHSLRRAEVDLMRAKVKLEQGDPLGGFQLACIALGDFEARTGRKSHSVARCLRTTGECRVRLADYSDAEKRLRQAHRILRALLPPYHSEVLEASLALAAIPGHTAPPGPMREFDALCRRLGEEHPTVRLWRRLLDNMTKAARAAGE